MNSLKKFLKIENKILMFAFVYSNFNVDFAQKMLMLLFEFKSYENCFDSKNAEIFFIYENENHVINLKFDKKSLYDFFYAFSEKKF